MSCVRALGPSPPFLLRFGGCAVCGSSVLRGPPRRRALHAHRAGRLLSCCSSLHWVQGRSWACPARQKVAKRWAHTRRERAQETQSEPARDRRHSRRPIDRFAARPLATRRTAFLRGSHPPLRSAQTSALALQSIAGTATHASCAAPLAGGHRQPPRRPAMPPPAHHARPTLQPCSAGQPQWSSAPRCTCVSSRSRRRRAQECAARLVAARLHKALDTAPPAVLESPEEATLELLTLLRRPHVDR